MGVDTGDHWTVGRENVFDVARAVVSSGREGAIVNVATTIEALSRLGLSQEDENVLLQAAWKACVETLEDAAGKRSSWRSFLFVVEGSSEQVAVRAALLYERLRQDREIDRTNWAVVVSPITPDWESAFKLAEPDNHDELRDPGRSMLARVVVNRGLPTVEILDSRRTASGPHASRPSGRQSPSNR